MYRNDIKFKPAFTMLELIFVIVILGIVASIGSQIIVKIYDSYITQRAIHRSSIKTELAATQLANRLAYSITGTVIGRKADNVTFLAVEDIPVTDTSYEMLEWISYDADSFGAVTATTTPLGRRPVWSGYCDINASSINSLSTPGSRLTKLSAIINNLSPSTKSIGDTAILFPSTYTSRTVGFSGTGSNNYNIHPVSTTTATDETLILDTPTDPSGKRTIKEHYKLAWTAYAIKPINLRTMPGTVGGAANNVYDLELWYDYQPWDGDSYTNGSNVVLIRNVSVFKFTGTGNTIRIKICQRENIGENYTITTCKEKAVIR